MTLHQLQSAFRDEIAAADDAATPSSTGMAIYRNAYRGRLQGVLEQCFERTRRWVGEEAFEAAACHYILTTPPRSWTVDDYGADFPAALEALFADDPEVAELAWREWHMQRAFAAPDRDELDPAALSALAPSDWNNVGFAMAAGFAAREVAHDGETEPKPLACPRVLLIWRHRLRTMVRLAELDEAQVLLRIAEGASLGEATDGLVMDAPERLAAWLAAWLSEGIFSGFALRD